jgi:8-oxo-dGTP diphosphatase
MTGTCGTNLKTHYGHMKLPYADKPCPHCGRYSNRGVSVDAVIIRGDQILLIQRGTEPDKGRWGTPGGFINWDETAEDALKREVLEETGLHVIKTRMVGVYSSPSRHPQQVINILYLTEVDDTGKLKHGDDAMDAKWFPLDALPDVMAFNHREQIEDVKRSPSLRSWYQIHRAC